MDKRHGSEWRRRDEKAAARGQGAGIGKAPGGNEPSAVDGKDRVRGPEDMDQPGAGPRQRSE